MPLLGGMTKSFLHCLSAAREGKQPQPSQAQGLPLTLAYLGFHQSTRQDWFKVASSKPDRHARNMKMAEIERRWSSKQSHRHSEIPDDMMKTMSLRAADDPSRSGGHVASVRRSKMNDATGKPWPTPLVCEIGAWGFKSHPLLNMVSGIKRELNGSLFEPSIDKWNIRRSAIWNELYHSILLLNSARGNFPAMLCQVAPDPSSLFLRPRCWHNLEDDLRHNTAIVFCSSGAVSIEPRYVWSITERRRSVNLIWTKFDRSAW